MPSPDCTAPLPHERGASLSDLEEINALLAAEVLPVIRGHAGDLKVISLSSSGEVGVEFSGACRACPLKAVTFYTAVRARLLTLRSVRSVRCEGIEVSEHAMRRLSALMAPGP